MYFKYLEMLESHPDSAFIQDHFYDIVTELVNRGFNEDNI